MNSELGDPRHIRTAPAPACAVCGNAGELTYGGLADNLFGAPGLWNLKKCSNRDCGLIWLDPMPLKEDIGKAYAEYYTHESQAGTGRIGRLKRVYQGMKRSYWASQYGYEVDRNVHPPANLWKLLYLFPMRRHDLEAEVRFLPALPNGRLLDVGCGSGDWLMLMRELGWLVEGVDFDEGAVAVAQQRGLPVSCGAVEEQKYPDASFDAVTLNHVIEHVPDPVGTLAECARILKPSGRLILATPNSCSVGHRIFKRNWRGLEPPRHLHVFSAQSLRRILEIAGFRNVSILPHIATSVIYESAMAWRGLGGRSTATSRNRVVMAFARLFNVAQFFLVKWNLQMADCVAVIASKE